MRRLISIVASLAVLAAAGCSGRDESLPRSFQAAVVPGADVSLRLDYSSARTSPAGEELAKLGQESNESGRELLKALEEATGVGRGDLEAIYFTADLDGIKLEGIREKDGSQEVDAVLAVSFKRALSEDGLKAGLLLLADGNPGTAVEETQIGGRRSFIIGPAGMPERGVHTALSQERNTVFVAPRRKSLEGAVSREMKKRPETVPPELARVEENLPRGSQLRSAFVLPASMRREIEERFSRVESETVRNPGSALFVSFAAPFRGIASLAAAAVLAERLDLLLAADLGEAESAQQAAAIFQTLGMPLLKAKLAETAGKKPSEMTDRISVASRGGTLQVSLTLSAKDLVSLAD